MGIHDNHRARMREKVFSGASRSFAPHEHLEILLYSSLPRTNTNEAAHALLQCGGDLNCLLTSYAMLKASVPARPDI